MTTLFELPCGPHSQADTFNSLIRRIDMSSGAVTTLAGRAGVTGSANGVGTQATFYWPSDVTLDASGTFALVCDQNNDQIRRISIADATVSTLVGVLGFYGCMDGTGLAAYFNAPRSVAVDGSGSLAIVVRSE